MKYNLIITLFLSSIILFACSNKKKNETELKENAESRERKEKSIVPIDLGLDNMVNQLIGFSAKDFLHFNQPQPIAFHTIRLKMMKTDNEDTIYMICGTFLSADQKNIPFATIKTSKYEQWIGASALSYCEKAIDVEYPHEQISSSLEEEVKKFNQELEKEQQL